MTFSKKFLLQLRLDPGKDHSQSILSLKRAPKVKNF